jgi:hypothetical protein
LLLDCRGFLCRGFSEAARKLIEFVQNCQCKRQLARLLVRLLFPIFLFKLDDEKTCSPRLPLPRKFGRAQILRAQILPTGQAQIVVNLFNNSIIHLAMENPEKTRDLKNPAKTRDLKKRGTSEIGKIYSCHRSQRQPPLYLPVSQSRRCLAVASAPHKANRGATVRFGAHFGKNGTKSHGMTTSRGRGRESVDLPLQQPPAYSEEVSESESRWPGTLGSRKGLPPLNKHAAEETYI